MNINLTTIATLSGLTPDDYPEPVRQALAFQSAADALAARVAAEAPVDLTAATTATIGKVHAAAVAHERDHAAAERCAAKLVTIAAGRVEAAWSAAVPAIAARCGAEFDQAAAQLTDALAALDPHVDPAVAVAEHWNPERAALRDALAILDRLRQVRDAVAYQAVEREVVSNVYARDSRTLVFDDAAAHQRFQRKLPADDRGVYYLVAAATPGVEIRWQTAPQQAEQTWPASIRRHRDAIAADNR